MMGSNDIVFDEKVHWDSLTQPYEDYSDRSYRQILNIIDFKENEIGLEIGCASGAWTRRIKSNLICALDLSSKQLLFIKNKHIARIQGDARNLMFKKGVFDRVFFSCSIHHIPNTDRVIREAKQILNNGGHLVIYDPNLHHPQRKLIRNPKSILRRFLSKNLTRYESCFYPAYYKGKLNEQGFEIELLEFVSPSYKKFTFQSFVQSLFRKIPFIPEKNKETYYIIIARKRAI